LKTPCSWSYKGIYLSRTPNCFVFGFWFFGWGVSSPTYKFPRAIVVSVFAGSVLKPESVNFFLCLRPTLYFHVFPPLSTLPESICAFPHSCTFAWFSHWIFPQWPLRSNGTSQLFLRFRGETLTDDSFSFLLLSV